MYGLAYVLFDGVTGDLQRTLRGRMAPFQRGGEDLFPIERLAFDDDTADLEQLHVASVTFVRSEHGGVQYGVPEGLSYDIDGDAVRDLLAAWGGEGFEGRLCDVEPDFDAFASRFWRRKKRDARTGRYGQWYNPLGRWDWWDLGGRFDSAILGKRGEHRVRETGLISSGASRGRDMVEGLFEVFGAAGELDALIEANVEPVSHLLEAAREGRRHAFPSAIVLPDMYPEDLRWVETPFFGDEHYRTGLPNLRRHLGLAPEMTFESVCRMMYEKHVDLAAAGVAFHF